jgi:uncharacterized YigZ family protein
MADTFRTLSRPARIRLKVADSRFLADAVRVRSVKKAKQQIDAVRQREHKATHHCTAYRIGPAGDTFRHDDDGEPSGTAGPPILRQIEARDLTDTLVVVTRYFGGTKLGTGGLVRAYGDAAAGVLDAASVVERIERVTVRLRFAYDDTAPARQVLGRFDTQILDERYGAATELLVGVRRSEGSAFIDAFTNALGGRGEAVRAGESG